MAKRPSSRASSRNGALETAPRTPAGAHRLRPPAGGVTVRMYRIGHGDCFLLAFGGEDPRRPTYVLIDCGYKPGSPGRIQPPTSPKEITENIRTATGGHIDIAIITHEHQDHLNAITAASFGGITIGQTWFAWTEDPEDDLANDLREVFKDTLLGVIAARNQLAAAVGADPKRVAFLEDLLAFELGGDDDAFNAADAQAVLAAASAANSRNKQSMKLFKERAEGRIEYLRPHEQILGIPRAPHVRVFPLGPPRNAERLKSLNPTGTEEFRGFRMAAAAGDNYLAMAARAAHDSQRPDPPFSTRYSLDWNTVLAGTTEHSSFFEQHYVNPPAEPAHEAAPPGMHWRRIDYDWLYASGQLALDMSNQTNNSSLVLAFELGKGGKVLLFAADAQRGNWISWAEKDFADGPQTVKVRDLLSRTVLYKVGHHGSHNATLNGGATDTYSNLTWMAEGVYGREFCAMITAVRAWAETQKGWDHPLQAIKTALLQKASGRVLQTDTDFATMAMPAGGSQLEWDDFKRRTTAARLFFDYQVEP